MSEETHYTSLIYFMPHWIFESEEISNTEKLLYALLSGLAHNNDQKECFPSDSYIAKRLKIDQDHAGVLVGKLADFGAIEKRTERHPKNAFLKIRYIKVNLELKKSLRSEKNLGSGAEKNLGQRTEKNLGYSNKDNSIYPLNPPRGGEAEEKSSEKPQKERYIDHVFLTKDEHKKLIDEFGEYKTKEYIKRLDAYIGSKGKKYKSHYKTILSWDLSDKKEVKLEKKEDPNKKGKGAR